MTWLIELIDYLTRAGPLSLSLGFNIIQALTIIWLYKDSQKKLAEANARVLEFLRENTETLALVLKKVLRAEDDEEEEDKRHRS